MLTARCYGCGVEGGRGRSFNRGSNEGSASRFGTGGSEPGGTGALPVEVSPPTDPVASTVAPVGEGDDGGELGRDVPGSEGEDVGVGSKTWRPSPSATSEMTCWICVGSICAVAR